VTFDGNSSIRQEMVEYEMSPAGPPAGAPPGREPRLTNVRYHRFASLRALASPMRPNAAQAAAGCGAVRQKRPWRPC
jgi:hypothetical protein